jgi:hypothetical protein
MQRVRDRFGSVSNDHHALFDARLVDRAPHPFDHRQTCTHVKNLWQRTLHAGALTGSKHKGGNGTIHR